MIGRGLQFVGLCVGGWAALSGFDSNVTEGEMWTVWAIGGSLFLMGRGLQSKGI